MKTSQLIHQTKLQNWALLLKEQAESGLSVKNWCNQNDISIHQYYYWKRILKEHAVESLFPEIVPVQIPATVSDTPAVPDHLPTVRNTLLHNSHNLYNSCNTPSLVIHHGVFSIDVSADISEELLRKVLKAVRHA